MRVQEIIMYCISGRVSYIASVVSEFDHWARPGNHDIALATGQYHIP